MSPMFFNKFHLKLPICTVVYHLKDTLSKLCTYAHTAHMVLVACAHTQHRSGREGKEEARDAHVCTHSTGALVACIHTHPTTAA